MSEAVVTLFHHSGCRIMGLKPWNLDAVYGRAKKTKTSPFSTSTLLLGGLEFMERVSMTSAESTNTTTRPPPHVATQPVFLL